MRFSFATFFIATALSALSATASPDADVDYASLLKRQAPGTSKHSCHSNCGSAISASKLPEPCKNQTFLDAYQSCLECAGPTKENIWSIYGRTLVNAGTACGLSTTPIDAPTNATATGNSTTGPPTTVPTGNSSSPTDSPAPGDNAGSSLTSSSFYALVVAGAALILV